MNWSQIGAMVSSLSTLYNQPGSPAATYAAQQGDFYQEKLRQEAIKKAEKKANNIGNRLKHVAMDFVPNLVGGTLNAVAQAPGQIIGGFSQSFGKSLGGGGGGMGGGGGGGDANPPSPQYGKIYSGADPGSTMRLSEPVAMRKPGSQLGMTGYGNNNWMYGGNE